MSVLDDVVGMAKTVAETAGKKTEELMSFSKVKIAAMNTNADLTKAYQRLGVIVFDAKKNKIEIDEVVDSIVDEIDELKIKLDEYNLKIAEMKKQRICTRCGTKNGPDAVFCNGCGAKLEED